MKNPITWANNNCIIAPSHCKSHGTYLSTISLTYSWKINIREPYSVIKNKGVERFNHFLIRYIQL